MRFLKLLLVILILNGCSQAGEHFVSNINDGSNSECLNSVQYGRTTLCLPKIDGMNECYSNELVKSMLDELHFEGTDIFAYYVNDSTYEHIDEIDQLIYDDFFQIYTIDQFKDAKLTNSDLDDVIKRLSESFHEEGWSENKKLIEAKLENVSVGKPIILDSYTLNDRVRTLILLNKNVSEEYEETIVYTMNMLNINNRLFMLSYYIDYDGEESIRNVKEKNNYVVTQFLEQNQ